MIPQLLSLLHQVIRINRQTVPAHTRTRIIVDYGFIVDREEVIVGDFGLGV
jgi:hypothetical protein